MARHIEFEIRNNTSVDFYRRVYKVKNGDWCSHLNETLRSNSIIKFIVESWNTPFSTFSGHIEYFILIYGIEIIITIQFIARAMSPLTVRNNIQVHAENVSLKSLITKIPSDLFNIVLRNGNTEDKFIIRIKESQENYLFLAARKIELEEAIKMLGHEYSNSLIPYEAFEKIPMHFFRCLNNKDWKSRIRKAPKSVIIRIINLTKHNLVLMNHPKHQAYLYEGIWSEMPSEKIPSMCFSEFGSCSSGVMMGTSGTCQYSVSSDSSYIQFIWVFSGLAVLHSEATHNTNKLTIQTFVHTYDGGNIYFHIIDPSDLPQLKICSAYNVPKSMSSNSLQDISRAIKENPEKFPNLLKPLEEYVSESEQSTDNIHESDLRVWHDQIYTYESNSLDDKVTQFLLSSPRAFFWGITNMKDQYSHLDPSGQLLLNWTIGCESFAYMWGPDESVSLDTTFSGGFDKKDVVINSVLSDFQQIPPIELIEKVMSNRYEITENGIVNILYRWSYRRNQIAKSNDLLVKLAFDCMKPLSIGLQNYLVESLSQKFGDKIKDYFRVPEHRYWSVSYVDLEYLILFMLENHHEIMDSYIDCKSELEIIKRCCTYWSSQIIEEFTYRFVRDFIHASEDLLTKLNIQDQLSHIKSLKFMLEGENIIKSKKPMPKPKSTDTSN